MDAKKPQKTILRGFLRLNSINHERISKTARRKRDNMPRISKRANIQLALENLADNHNFKSPFSSAL